MTVVTRPRGAVSEAQLSAVGRHSQPGAHTQSVVEAVLGRQGGVIAGAALLVDAPHDAKGVLSGATQAEEVALRREAQRP